MIGVNQEPIEPLGSQQPFTQRYYQKAQSPSERPQQHQYIEQFPQDVRQSIIAKGYKERKIVPLHDPKSVAKEPKSENEAVKSARRLHLWKCELCTTSNNADAANCGTCGTPRMSDEVKVEEKLQLQTAHISEKQQAIK